MEETFVGSRNVLASGARIKKKEDIFKKKNKSTLKIDSWAKSSVLPRFVSLSLSLFLLQFGNFPPLPPGAAAGKVVVIVIASYPTFRQT